MHNRINVISAPAGSGKSYTIINHIRKNPNNRFIIAVPSKELVLEYTTNLLTLPLIIPVLSRDRSNIDPTFDSIINLSYKNKLNVFFDKESDVVTAINSGLTKIKDSNGGILICTHKALMMMRKFPNFQNCFDLFVDEIPEIQEFEEIQIWNNKTYLRNLFTFLPFNDKVLKVELKEKQRAKLEKIYSYNGIQDCIDKVFEKPVKTLLNGGQVYVHKTRYDAIFKKDQEEEDKSVKKDKESKSLKFLYITDLSFLEGFNQVTILGANFKDTFFSKLLEQQNILTESPAFLKKSLRFTQHDGSNVLLYICQGNNWSIESKNENIHGEHKVGYLIKESMKLFPGEEFIITGNNDDNQRYKEYRLFDGANYCSPLSRGINHFSHIPNVVYFPSLNPSNERKVLLQSVFKMDDDEIFTAEQGEKLYQFVMRSALRLNDNREIKIIVPDLRMAKFLQKLFVGSQIMIPDFFIETKEKKSQVGKGKGAVGNNTGQYWITNGLENKMVKPEAKIPRGWRKGKTQKKKDEVIV